MNVTHTKEQFLLAELDRISDYYGCEIAEVLIILDRYLRYYHTTEKQKFELQDAVRKFEEDEIGGGIDNLLASVKCFYDSDERRVSVIDDDMFDMERVKEILIALTIYQVRKEPETEEKRRKVREQF